MGGFNIYFNYHIINFSAFQEDMIKCFDIAFIVVALLCRA